MSDWLDDHCTSVQANSRESAAVDRAATATSSKAEAPKLNPLSATTAGLLAGPTDGKIELTTGMANSATARMRWLVPDSTT